MYLREEMSMKSSVNLARRPPHKGEGPMPTSLLPQVVVKFADSVPINLGQGNTLGLDQLADIVGSNGATAIDAIRQVLPDLAFSRLFDSLSPDDIQALIGRTKDNDPSYVPPNFETY